jgi:hypothetical protein
MKELGRSLVFHLKYWDEMNALYWEEDDKFIGNLKDPDKILEMVQAIGDNACEQAASFLQICADNLMKYISLFCNARIKSQRRSVEINWDLEIDLWPKRRKKPNSTYCQMGFTILDPEECPADWYPSVLPWMWVRGGNPNEEKLIQILGEKAKSGSRDFNWQGGTVVLDRIRLLPQGLEGFEVDAYPFIDQCVKAFRLITEKDVNRIFEIANS